MLGLPVCNKLLDCSLHPEIQSNRTCLLSLNTFSSFSIFLKYVFIYLVVLDSSCSSQDLWSSLPCLEAFSCGMWTPSHGMWELVPWPGIEPRPPALGARRISHPPGLPHHLSFLIPVAPSTQEISLGTWALFLLWIPLTPFKLLPSPVISPPKYLTNSP